MLAAAEHPEAEHKAGADAHGHDAHAEAAGHDDHGHEEHKEEAFNPVAKLFDRYSAWEMVDFETGGDKYVGIEFVKSWNTSVGTTDPAKPTVLAISQHVIMMWVAAAIVLVIGLYVTFLKRSRIPRGWRNFIEPIALFIRDEVARPNIKNTGHHDHGHDHKHEDHAHEHNDDHGHDQEHEDHAQEHKDDHAAHAHAHTAENPHMVADKFAPFLLTTFLFIAAMNLIGLIPGSTTATSAITVTMGLALVTMTTYVVGAIIVQGPVGYIKNLVPYQFSTKPLDLGIWSMLLVIELIGLLTKPFALTVRLFANMTAGHCVILSLLFINLLVHNMVGGYWPAASGVPTVLMSVAIYGLEIFVAILQAYIFTYLSAIFIGGYLAPEH